MLGDIGWAVLSYSDAERLRRLKARRVQDAKESTGTLTDAAELRVLGLPVIGTDLTIDTTVQQLAGWVRQQLTR